LGDAAELRLEQFCIHRPGPSCFRALVPLRFFRATQSSPGSGSLPSIPRALPVEDPIRPKALQRFIGNSGAARCHHSRPVDVVLGALENGFTTTLLK
jgi:hypothetical protein